MMNFLRTKERTTHILVNVCLSASLGDVPAIVEEIEIQAHFDVHLKLKFVNKIVTTAFAQWIKVFDFNPDSHRSVEIAGRLVWLFGNGPFL